MKSITWDDYYDRFYDLSPSTQRSYSYQLSCFGASEEVLEVIQEFALEAQSFAARFTEKAIRAGVQFSPEQVLELALLVDQRVLGLAARNSSECFDREQLEEIYDLIDDISFEHISDRAQIDIFSDEDTDYEEPEEAVEMSDSACGKSPGLFAALFDIFVGDDRKKDHEKCDGDCANCPDHYGYRYGRWYYGHGHQHGCQRCGNGGASGRTYRD